MYGECSVGRAKMAEPIKLQLGLANEVGSGNCRRAHWRHLANTVERLCAATMSGSATRGGDAAYSQITSGNLVTIIIKWYH